MEPNGKHAKIVITGGIGSGKSAAGKILQDLGYPVFSCDEIYAGLCKEREFLELLGAHFPGCVEGGVLRREVLSRIVFENETARQTINALSHPLIMARLFEKMRPFPLSFAEVPLLFETHSEREFDRVLVILRETERRIEAVRARSGLSRAEILSRMARQFDYSQPRESYPENCVLLENNSSLADLKNSLLKALKDLL